MRTIYHFIFSLCMLLCCARTPAASATTTPLTVMTFNIENGGTQINFNHVAEIIRYAHADVVGIQEAWGHLERLATLLHWPYINRRQHIISRLPLYAPAEGDQQYVYIEVAPHKIVAMSNTHLPDDPYGPDLVMTNATQHEVIANEKRTRLRFIASTIATLKTLAQQNVPVILTGDFNSPSHLDWTDATTHTLPHHRYAVPWPVTSTLMSQGFHDSYRLQHPDPVTQPGITWPAMRPVAKHSYDGYNPSTTDLADRIDFIFVAGPVSTHASEIIGEKTMRGHQPIVTQWPSDHRAVVSTLRVTPSDLPRDATLSKPRSFTPHVSASIHISPHRVKYNEDIVIHWQHAPGYGYDYISIRDKANTDAVRLYTRGQSQGTLRFNATMKQGNWPAWYPTTEAHWPLAPGHYVAKLMRDDSQLALATANFEVLP